jgi:hypothetical protein
MADAVDVDPPYRTVGIAGDGDPGGQVEHEFGSGKGALECRSVEDIGAYELDVEPVQRCTGPEIDGPDGLGSGEKGAHDVGPEVP